MTRKYRPHQCPKCANLDPEAYSTHWVGLCIKDNQKYQGIGVWLEGESKRGCPFFIVVSKQREDERC